VYVIRVDRSIPSNGGIILAEKKRDENRYRWCRSPGVERGTQYTKDAA